MWWQHLHKHWCEQRCKRSDGDFIRSVARLKQRLKVRKELLVYGMNVQNVAEHAIYFLH